MYPHAVSDAIFSLEEAKSFFERGAIEWFPKGLKNQTNEDKRQNQDKNEIIKR